MQDRDGSAPPTAMIAVEPGLSPAIDAVAERAPASHAFLRSAWYGGAANDLRGASTLVARRPDGVPFAAIPTMPTGPSLIGARHVPGSYWPFRGLALAKDASDAEIAALVTHPAARALAAPVLRIGPFYADDPVLSALNRVAGDSGWAVLERRIGTTFRIDIPNLRGADAWPRKSALRRMRTIEKQLAQLGAVHIRHISGDGWTPQVFADLATIEEKSWVGRNTDRSGAKFLAPDRVAGWLRATDDPVLARMLTATILYVGDTPAAFTFDLLCGTMQYGIAGSYDERFATHSVGKLVTYRQFDTALERGIETIDLGAGDSGYKRELGAVAGPDIIDCLIVRRRSTAALLRRKWTGPNADDVPVPASEGARGFGTLERLLLVGVATAAAAVAMAE